MSQGHEAFVSVSEHWKGWGTDGFQYIGLYPELDSEALSPNINIKERDGKIRVGREAQANTFSAEADLPAGNFVAQPRTDDFLSIFMAFFQAVDPYVDVDGGSATGSLIFVPISEDPDWVGSTWGTAMGGTLGVAGDVYPIAVLKCFTDDWTTYNGEKYTEGIVESLEFSQPFGEDLTITPTFKFRDVDLNVDLRAYKPNGAQGSYSTKLRFVDWKGTVAFTYGGVATAVELSNITFTLSNNTTDKGKIGYKGWSRFPFSGRPMFEGNLDLELQPGQRDLAQIMANGGSATLSVNWWNSATDRLFIEFPNIKLRTFDRPISSGDAPIDYTLPFRAYPIGTLPGVKFTVWSVYATQGLTVHAGVGATAL